MFVWGPDKRIYDLMYLGILRFDDSRRSESQEKSLYPDSWCEVTHRNKDGRRKSRGIVTRRKRDVAGNQNGDGSSTILDPCLSFVSPLSLPSSRGARVCRSLTGLSRTPFRGLDS